MKRNVFRLSRLVIAVLVLAIILVGAAGERSAIAASSQ